MKPFSDADAATPRLYVQHLHLRNSATRHVYRCILSGFQRFIREHHRSEPISLEVVQDWLRDRILRWPLHLVIHRASLVDRFLDWMVDTRSLSINPFAQLRKQYTQPSRRTTAPIVRALLSPDPAAALQQLRPLPRFGSFLGAAMRDHVALMKSMGYRYDTYEQGLRRFDRFLQNRPSLSGQPLKALVREWVDSGSTAQHALERNTIGRVLSKALRRKDSAIEAVPFDRRLQQQVRRMYRRPYIYSEDEVRRLLETARRFPSPHSPLRPQMLYTMLVLAYCAGLRLGEIVHLNVGDIHLGDETIDIRDSKFFKSRRLPLAPSVMAALRDYLHARKLAGAPDASSSGLFWHQRASGRYSHVMTGKLLVRVLRLSGLKPAQGRAGPRIHDLRHAFVVNRMLAWYRQGANPQSRLPYLATYLGHKDINSTLVYLTITQELLQQAGDRFRASASAVLASLTGGRA